CDWKPHAEPVGPKVEVSRAGASDHRRDTAAGSTALQKEAEGIAMSTTSHSQHSGEPPFVMDDVKLLFSDLTTPETSVKFDPPSRANPSTIQNSIYPPEATWIWADDTAREGQPIGQSDLGKYGLQTNINTMFRLVGVSPNVIWQPVQNFTTASWTWPNATAR